MCLYNASETELDVFMSSSLILKSLQGKITGRPPCWLMRQAGRYLPEYRALRTKAGSFLELCLSPKMATEVTLQPIRRFDLDAAILFSDILIVPYGLGQALHFEEGYGPKLEAISKPSDVLNLCWDTYSARIEPTYEVVERTREKLANDVVLIGFAGAPWTVATYMIEGGSSRDYAKTKRWAYDDPEGFATLIDLLIKTTVRHLLRQIEAGAQVVKLFDSWSGVLAPDQFMRWTVDPIRQISEQVRSMYPDIPIIGFPRGAGVRYQKFAESAGVDAVALDTSVPTDWAARNLQNCVPVQGNLDPVALVAGGTAMKDCVRRIRADLCGGPFIFNLGHGVLPSTPPENVESLVKMLKEPG